MFKTCLFYVHDNGLALNIKDGRGTFANQKTCDS